MGPGEVSELLVGVERVQPLNAYFLHAGVTRFADTFGRNDRYREQFAEVVKMIGAKDKVVRGKLFPYPSLSRLSTVTRVILFLSSTPSAIGAGLILGGSEVQDALETGNVVGRPEPG